MNFDDRVLPTRVAVPGGVAFLTSSLDSANAALKEVMMADEEMKRGRRCGNDVHNLARWTLYGVDARPRLYR